MGAFCEDALSECDAMASLVEHAPASDQETKADAIVDGLLCSMRAIAKNDDLRKRVGYRLV